MLIVLLECACDDEPPLSGEELGGDCGHCETSDTMLPSTYNVWGVVVSGCVCGLVAGFGTQPDKPLGQLDGFEFVCGLLLSLDLLVSEELDE